ncbi:MAG: hypothetical protein ACREOS_11110, partial [Candidatus Dormibacteraceae bacterium]
GVPRGPGRAELERARRSRVTGAACLGAPCTTERTQLGCVAPGSAAARGVGVPGESSGTGSRTHPIAMVATRAHR